MFWPLRCKGDTELMMSVSIRKPPIHKMIGLQCGLSVIAVVLSFIIAGREAAISALLGGVIAAVPNAYFAWRAFSYNQTRSATGVLESFLRAEVSKLALTALLFGFVFKFMPPQHVGILFAAFIVVLIGGLLGSMMFLQGQKK